MTSAIIISICVLLLIAYIFDVSSPKTRIPSVILLLLVGWAVRQGANFLGLHIPDLSPILPVIGTVGLILVVLEGSLEVELNRSKLGLIVRSTVVALLPIILLSMLLALAFEHFDGISFRTGLLNAIPLCVISSTIAISSSQNLPTKDSEFVTYESSLSDIFGVIFFNFVVRNEVIDLSSFTEFGAQIVIILVVTVAATLGLSFLLSKIKHHVKFLPIILLIILIYTIAKMYHLPALIFIFVLGLFIGNLDKFERFRFMKRLRPEILVKEVSRLQELTKEITFSIRSLFFLLFGYLIETSELLNTNTLVWAIAISGGIFLVRFIFLKLSGQNVFPLLFIAPRGLITILLFISIPVGQTTNLVNNSLIIQVIIITALIMMIGLMTTGNGKEKIASDMPQTT
ncbi:MAG: sodium:proton antiporter [Bacteroidota bacterium]|nr:Na(+)/H(+) exchanger family protein [Bacteroidetes oral taxon 274 str. F0058]